MGLRVFLGGIAGGLVLFLAGFLAHVGLGWQSRTIMKIDDDRAFADQARQHELSPGLYMFPDMLTSEEQKDAAKWADATERLEKGPAGLLLVWPKGAGFMPEMIGKELVSNVLAALLAAWIVSLAAADVGYFRRFLVVFFIGLVSWLSIGASYGIWYRFPHDFVHDEALCAMLEWSAAGLVIAAIVRRPAIAVVPAAV